MTNKNLFKMAHAMANGIKSNYPEVDYNFQFSLCLKYLRTSKEEVAVVATKGFDFRNAEKGIRDAEKLQDAQERSNYQIVKQLDAGHWICKTDEGFEFRTNSDGNIKKSTATYAWKVDGTVTKSTPRPIEKTHFYSDYLETLNK